LLRSKPARISVDCQHIRIDLYSFVAQRNHRMQTVADAGHGTVRRS
jgi:hypothetical protein